MRKNLTQMLDKFGAADRLGLGTSAELFGDDVSELTSSPPGRLGSRRAAAVVMGAGDSRRQMLPPLTRPGKGAGASAPAESAPHRPSPSSLEIGIGVPQRQP